MFLFHKQLGLNEAIAMLDRNTRMGPSNMIIISPVDKANSKDYSIFSIGDNISTGNNAENILRVIAGVKEL